MYQFQSLLFYDRLHITVKFEKCNGQETIPNMQNSILYVNSLRSSDVIRQHRSGSTLAQVMACCLMAPSHYLNQCWLIISKVLYHSLRTLSKETLRVPISKACLKIEFLKLHPNPPGANELNENMWAWLLLYDCTSPTAALCRQNKFIFSTIWLMLPKSLFFNIKTILLDMERWDSGHFMSLLQWEFLF